MDLPGSIHTCGARVPGWPCHCSGRCAGGSSAATTGSTRSSTCERMRAIGPSASGSGVWTRITAGPDASTGLTAYALPSRVELTTLAPVADFDERVDQVVALAQRDDVVLFVTTALEPAADPADYTARGLVVLAECPDGALVLGRAGSPLTDLAPRLARVLGCLLEGDGEKQVAKRLRLSPHTVREYVTLLYRHFDTHSRAELIAACVRLRITAAQCHRHGVVFVSGR